MHYIRRMHYRVYLLSRSGEILRAADLDAADDAAAWVAARREFVGHASLELWSGKRYVGTTPLNP